MDELISLFMCCFACTDCIESTNTNDNTQPYREPINDSKTTPLISPINS
jgi:hypothetical protein